MRRFATATLLALAVLSPAALAALKPGAAAPMFSAPAYLAGKPVHQIPLG